MMMIEIVMVSIVTVPIIVAFASMVMIDRNINE